MQSGGGGGTDTSRTTVRSRDIVTDPPFQVGDFICKYCTFVQSRRFAAMQMNDDSWCGWDVGLWRSRNTALDDRKRAGGIGVVGVPIFVVAFRLVSTRRSCSVSRIWSTKRRFSNLFQPREGRPCPRLRQELSWYNFDGCFVRVLL